MDQPVEQKRRLIEEATRVRLRAYAPHSKFPVGAALRTSSGRVFSGCNVENLSFGLTLCAERVCIGSAIAAGERKFNAIAIVADSREPIVPCGACRQVMAEFNAEVLIYSATLTGKTSEFRLSELLPLPRQGILD